MGVGTSRCGCAIFACSMNDEQTIILRLALCGRVVALYESYRDPFGMDEYPHGLSRKWFLCYTEGLDREQGVTQTQRWRRGSLRARLHLRSDRSMR